MGISHIQNNKCLSYTMSLGSLTICVVNHVQVEGWWMDTLLITITHSHIKYIRKKKGTTLQSPTTLPYTGASCVVYTPQNDQ